MTTSPTDLDTAMAAAGLVPGQSPSPLLAPVPATLFATRAARLRVLADGHALEGWLSFVAVLVEAQARLAAAAPSAPAGDPASDWIADLTALLGAIDGPLPPPGVAAVERLKAALPAQLAELQQRLDQGQGGLEDLASAPFIAAARQLAWSRFAAATAPGLDTPPATAHKCPVCGEPPVAAMIQIGAGSAGLRYLHCGLCGTAWHHVRAACVVCGDAKGVVYHGIEGGEEGVRAECCASCHSTLKLFLLEKNPAYEAVADDLATLPLDMLVSEAGYDRVGANPFLVIGVGG